MTWIVFTLLLGCVPRPHIMCARDVDPVCARGTQYANMCSAEAAGYYDECSKYVVRGPCVGAEQVPRVSDACGSSEFLSESTHACVPKPWSDFVSCAVEKTQGACPNGRDPNRWVAVHCSATCAS